ncbi:hypothetical protein TBLA_0B01300 [Henningerozyma blattae CBS 6284]|uniref:Maf-like protein n=1 Tax=Henningerozyma blattae (strain ATCC 34711 / CBS 6284 / DSM 70876 / NBRC 10599 / NRRL Y-10934 / UCD 77-7) TaxID=1071380 RepID=I2GXX1_HENB6|nr:hypothetical protein TBLA_0B01300 [Tetrapisispora blattae CBS 6284]CCH58973.1 hypothetical protein TBLA_0B01300 [Tetrapisispora blattae CBS 6284]
MSRDSPPRSPPRSPPIVLGSSSPQRAHILRTVLGIENFKVVPSHCPEDLDPLQYESAKEYALATCNAKLDCLLQRQASFETPSVVVVADTVVADCDGRVYGKPHDSKTQYEMLAHFIKGPFVEIHTALRVVVVVCKNSVDDITSHCETTRLVFDPTITPHVLRDYINTGEGINAAGGFCIQAGGGALVKSVEGDYYNVVGLPANALFNALLAVKDFLPSRNRRE